MSKKTTESIHSMLRVNYAGERAATRIYQAQLKVLGDSSIADALKKMKTQEEEHLKAFDDLMQQHQVPPTLFEPLWDKASSLLGLMSALAGKKAAHACTIAVEEVIEQHYHHQLQILKDKTEHTKLRTLIQRCLDDETAHKNIAQDAGGRDCKIFSKKISHGISLCCQLAIALSKRI